MRGVLPASGVEVHALSFAGDAQRPVLVFLHGGLGAVSQWSGFCEQLCRRTGCPGLAFDRHGHGLSPPLVRDRSIHYLHRNALEELPHVLATHIPERPYLLIGHSDGGSIALIAGAERPSLLRGIVTVAAHVFVEPGCVEGIAQMRVAYTEGGLRRALMRYHGDKADTLFSSWVDTWTSLWFRAWNIEYLLPSIEAPLLVLQGREDQYGTIAQVDAITRHSAGPATPLLLEECGHAPHREFPELTLDLMSCFINRTARQ